MILSLQLSFAVIPLVKFTGSREKMGPFATPRGWLVVAWAVAAVIAGLNGYLVAGQIYGWAEAAGRHAWLVYATVGPVAGGLTLLLFWMTFRRESAEGRTRAASADAVASAALRTRSGSTGSASRWTPATPTPRCSPRPWPSPAPTAPSWC